MIQEAIENAHVHAALRVIFDGSTATEFINEVDQSNEVRCPDLILLDMNLPKKSGDEVLRHLRNSSRCSSVPVIIVSSSDASPDRDAVSDFSIAGWFKKASDYAEYMKLGLLIKNLLQAPPKSSR
jgi:DNA-binding response OmpR family regulator